MDSFIHYEQIDLDRAPHAANPIIGGTLLDGTPTFIDTVLDAIHDQNSKVVSSDGYVANGPTAHQLADLWYISQARLAVMTDATVQTWQNGEKTPPAKAWQLANAMARAHSKTMDVAAERVFATFDGRDMASLHTAFAHFLSGTVNLTVAPKFQLPLLDHATRASGRMAFIPHGYRMLGLGRGRPPMSMDVSSGYRALLRTACVTEFLANVMDTTVEIVGQQSRVARQIESLRPLLLENEALIRLYEDYGLGVADEEGKHLWLLPTPPVYDFGAYDKTTSADIHGFWYGAGRLLCTSAIDIKKEKGAQLKNKRGSNQVQIVDARQIGSLSLSQFGTLEVDYSKNARMFVEGHMRMPDGSRYENPRYRAAVALSTLGLILTKNDIDHFASL